MLLFLTISRIAGELEDAEAKYLDSVEDPFIDKRDGKILFDCALTS